MEIGLFFLGALLGYGFALAFDVLYYQRSASFTKTLDAAQARIDTLQAELGTLRQSEAERETPPPTFLMSEGAMDESPAPDEFPRLESQNADHARVAELEERLETLRRESLEADRRARLFEARLIDASSELASLRYGLPTLDRKAEDDLDADDLLSSDLPARDLAEDERREDELESPRA